MERLDAHRELAGAVSDRELATLAGVSTSAARQYRSRLGREASRPAARSAIPASTAAPRLPPLAPTAPDRPAAEIVAEAADRLDTLPDWMLARELRVTVADIDAFRAAQRRPRSEPDPDVDPARRNRSRPSSAPPAAPRAGAEERIAAQEHLIGRVADIHVAEAARVSVAEVAAWRRAHGR